MSFLLIAFFTEGLHQEHLHRKSKIVEETTGKVEEDICKNEKKQKKHRYLNSKRKNKLMVDISTFGLYPNRAASFVVGCYMLISLMRRDIRRDMPFFSLL